MYLRNLTPKALIPQSELPSNLKLKCPMIRHFYLEWHAKFSINCSQVVAGSHKLAHSLLNLVMSPKTCVIKLIMILLQLLNLRKPWKKWGVELKVYQVTKECEQLRFAHLLVPQIWTKFLLFLLKKYSVKHCWRNLIWLAYHYQQRMLSKTMVNHVEELKKWRKLETVITS